MADLCVQSTESKHFITNWKVSDHLESIDPWFALIFGICNGAGGNVLHRQTPGLKMEKLTVSLNLWRDTGAHRMLV